MQPRFSLTVSEIGFPAEQMALGPLGMKVWCPTGIEVSMTEEVQRANPPGWNLMMSKPPLDVNTSSQDSGIIPMKLDPLPDSTTPTGLPPPPPTPAGTTPGSGTYTGDIDSNGQFVWKWTERPPAPAGIPTDLARGEMGAITKGAYVYFPPTTNLKDGTLSTSQGQYVWMNRVAQKVPRLTSVYGREGSSITTPNGQVISWGPGEMGYKSYQDGWDTQFAYTTSKTNAQGVTINSDSALYSKADLEKAGLAVEHRDEYAYAMSGLAPGSRVQLNRSVYGDVGEQIADGNGNVMFSLRGADILNKSETLDITDPYWTQFSNHYGATSGRSTGPRMTYEQAMVKLKEEQSKGIGIPNTTLIGLLNGVYQLADIVEQAKAKGKTVQEVLNPSTSPVNESIRNSLSWPDKVRFDLTEHLEKQGYIVESDNLIENVQMTVSSFFWAFDGGLFERDTPEVATAIKIGVFIASFEAGFLGKMFGTASQEVGRGIQFATELSSSARAARGGSAVLSSAEQTATRLGRQFELFGELKNADVSRQSFLSIVPKFSRGMINDMKTWPRQISQQFQRFMRDPEAVQLLMGEPKVASSFFTRLKSMISPAKWRSLASSIRTGGPQKLKQAMTSLASEFKSNMSRMWNQAGRLITLSERQALRQQSNAFSGLRQGTRNVARRRNMQSYRDSYNITNDVMTLRRQGFSAKEAIDRQVTAEIAADLEAARKRRRILSSTL